MHTSFRITLFVPLFVSMALARSYAQPHSGMLTEADYARAERFMGYNTSQLVDRATVKPNWLDDGRFWYRVLTAQGSEFVLVNPVRGTREAAFDQQKLAAALSGKIGRGYDAFNLPFASFKYSNGGNTITFDANRANWMYDITTGSLNSRINQAADTRQDSVAMSVSPDKKRAVFIRNYNLWLRDLTLGREMPLTVDGIKDFGYATDNAGWKRSDAPIVTWSPDSRKIATYQQDQRHVSDMYLVTTNVGKPTLEAWKYPLPGDKDVARIHRVIINVDRPEVIRLQLAPDVHRGTLCDDISCIGNEFGDVDWSSDASQLAFVSTSRDHKQEILWIADAVTGRLRQVMQETSPTQFESGRGAGNWQYLAASNEVIWYSERDNWGHLYLYDAATGKLKNQITKGEWAVSKVVRVDEKDRTIYFLAGGREPGNPYFSHLYKINFDGRNLHLLTPEAGNHQPDFSPSGEYFVDTYSKPDAPPVTVLRNTDGKLITTLEKADITRLLSIGWQPPVQIVVKARDGKTDLYGLMYTPVNPDLNQKYPVVNYIYPGPQGGSIRSWSFESATVDHQALAELGFVVVAIEGTCNPGRSKSFHDMCYGNIADNTLPDQIEGIKQLAQKYPYLDVDRVGVWGHSGGGYAAAAAMFRFPDFYKVGISESGNHDNRNYEDDWGERYIGLLKVNGDSTSNYDAQANQNYAKNLKGKLMLAHGMMDDNVPPYNTLLVVDALIKANKDFDLVIFPNSRHGYGQFSNYMTRRRWDYFVRNLLHLIPPHEYQLKTKRDPRNTEKYP